MNNSKLTVVSYLIDLLIVEHSSNIESNFASELTRIPTALLKDYGLGKCVKSSQMKLLPKNINLNATDLNLN